MESALFPWHFPDYFYPATPPDDIIAIIKPNLIASTLFYGFYVPYGISSGLFIYWSQVRVKSDEMGRWADLAQWQQGFGPQNAALAQMGYDTRI